MRSLANTTTTATAGGSPASGRGEPSYFEAAQGGWKRFIGPLLGLAVTAGVAAGLVLALDGRMSLLLEPDENLGGASSMMQCGVYQDPADPTVQLTDAEIWDAAGA